MAQCPQSHSPRTGSPAADEAPLGGRSESDWGAVYLLFQTFDEVDIALHGLFLRLPLHPIPRVPLRALDHVGEAGALGVHVAHAALLIERIELQQRHVVGLL